jgi:hypothetical protein
MSNVPKNLNAVNKILLISVIIALVVVSITVGFIGNYKTNSIQSNYNQLTSIEVLGANVSASGQTTVYLEQTSGSPAIVNALTIKDSSGNTTATISGTNAFGAGVNTVSLTVGKFTTVSGNTPKGIIAGSTYTVTVTTLADGSFVSLSVVATT